MQSTSIPLISDVIPRIDDLVCVIDDFKDDTSKHPAVQSAAVWGLIILNKYYQKSDESFVYPLPWVRCRRDIIPILSPPLRRRFRPWKLGFPSQDSSSITHSIFTPKRRLPFPLEIPPLDSPQF